MHALKEIQCFLLDMDGTVYLSGKPIPGAVEAVGRMRRQGRVLFLTNNTSASRADYVKKLNALGFDADERDVYTAGLATIDWLKTYRSGKRVFLLGTDNLREEFEASGIESDDETPEIAVVGFDTGLRYDRLCRLCAHIRRGVEFIATHPDFNCPVTDGYIPDVGSFLALIEASTGRRPSVICGKPYQPMADAIGRLVGLPANQIAMFGDRLMTDMRFAVANGFMSVLVLSGEATEADLKKSGLGVSAVLPSIAEWDS